MRGLTAGLPTLAPTDTPAAGTFEAIYRALDACTTPLVGGADLRLLAIPIHDDAGEIAGGLWGGTLFRWLHVQLLVVPPVLRGRGVGTLLMRMAEAEAWSRGCCGVFVDALACQAAGFYEKLGYAAFGELRDFPPGHRRIYFSKRFGGVMQPVLATAPRAARLLAA